MNTLLLSVAMALPPLRVELKDARSPGAVAIVDVNEDGKADVVVANQESDNVSILLGDGHGGLREAGPPIPGGNCPNDIGAADFNGDRHVDLALANHDSDYVTVLSGDGRGGFRPAPGSPFKVTSDPHPHGIATGDFNADRAPDLVIESFRVDSILLLLNDGKGGFASPGRAFAVGDHPYHKLRVADVNRDGHPDVVTSNFGGANVTILEGDGRGGLREAPGSPVPTDRSPFGVAVGDVNGDGLPDLATVHYSGSVNDPSRDGVVILLAEHRGGFRRAEGALFKTGRAPVAIAMGDVDGDGLADVATANFGSDDVTLLTKAGRESRTLAVGQHPEAVALGDVDGDGKADVVAANAKSNDVTVYLSSPSRPLGASPLPKR